MPIFLLSDNFYLKDAVLQYNFTRRTKLLNPDTVMCFLQQMSKISLPRFGSAADFIREANSLQEP